MNDAIAQAQVQVHPPTFGGQQQVSAAVDSLSPAVPPLPHRRPRVREVSSRFMSSVVSSSSSPGGDLHHHAPKSPLPKHAVISTPNPPDVQSRQQQQQQQHRSKSVQRRRQEPEPLCRADENIPDTIRSLETPLGLHSKVVMSLQRKQRPSVKLSKENGGRAEQQQLSDVSQSQSQSKSLIGGKFSGRGGIVTPSRPDTPTVTGTDRMISSRFRLGTQNLARPTNVNITPVTAAAKLLQSSGMSLSAQPPNPDSKVNGDTSKESVSASVSVSVSVSFPLNHPSTDVRDEKDITQALAKIPTFTGSDSCSTAFTCTSPPISAQNSKAPRSIPDLRASLPEVDALSTLSTRLMAERSCTVGDVIGFDSSKFSPSPCSRSLNLPLSSCEQSSLLHLHALKAASEKPPSTLSKPFANNSVKAGNLCLPPLPCSKLGADSRRGRKVFSHQEEVHSLKLLHNHYLQWRFANAKAEASMHAQRKETERKLYSLGVKISNLCDAVKRKRIELALLKQSKTLSTIIEAHMPYLDEWSTLEGEYSSSLSEAIHALLNASLQLPVSGNVQADIREIGEALNSAIQMTETIGLHIQSFMPKAEEMDALISELARVIGGERAFIEECGLLLFKTYTSQVEELSLRGHLIQLHQSNHHQLKEE